MTTGNNDFEPEYVSRCNDAIENIGRKYIVGIIFFSMVITSLTMSELVGDQSSSYADTGGPVTRIEASEPLKVNAIPEGRTPSMVICEIGSPSDYRSS